MSVLSFCITLCISFFLLSSPLLAAASLPTDAAEISPAKVVEIKTFQLQHKEVVAIAVEACLPAANIATPSDYSVEPQYHLTDKNGSITLTIDAEPALPNNPALTKNASSFLKTLAVDAAGNTAVTLTAQYQPATAKASVTTVKRKQISGPANTLIYRTYLVLTFAATTPPPKTIVLDPGHGGPALGATANELIEKELNLDIALLSRDLFRDRGYDVYMTRTDDSNPSLLDRADAANILQADIFLSVHNNSVPTDMADAAKKLYRGTTALYNAAAPKPAKELATLLADEIASTLRIHQYPLQDRPKLVVLNSTWVPAVIAEVAMMPHPQDAKLLSQRVYRQLTAEAIGQAVEKYFALTATECKGGL